ncbi:hypothetical protein [Peribacillus phoenicis]|uniref:hypothetical protein n=1 Tax=unclassified Peribacillus TaxID=2675266 RepID=UPI0039A0BAED
MVTNEDFHIRGEAMKHCIYLKKTEPEVSFQSGEHIFPAGIGGIQKLPLEYVSHECNNAFSGMEGPFMRSSLLSLPRQFEGPGKRGKLNPNKATKSNVHLISNTIDPTAFELGYTSLGVAYSLPQVKMNKDGNATIILGSTVEEDGTEELDEFKKRLATFEGKYVLIEHEQYDQDEFILGYLEGKWFVALGNKSLEEEITSFIERLIEAPLKEELKTETYQPKTHQILEINTDEYYRVCAKIIFNYLAYAKGQDFALRDEFNPLRAWIVHGGGNKFANLTGEEKDFKIPFPDQAHKLFIVKHGKSLIGYISFYGNAFTTIVQLCEDFDGVFELDGFICDWKQRKEYSFIDYAIALGSN